MCSTCGLCCSSEARLRNLLKKRPLVLHRSDGSVFRIGGGDQCTEGVQRRICARMNNWVTLVKDVVRAELPSFEVFSSMSSLLQLEGGGDTEQAAKRIGHVLGVAAATLPQPSLAGLALCQFLHTRSLSKLVLVLDCG